MKDRSNLLAIYLILAFISVVVSACSELMIAPEADHSTKSLSSSEGDLIQTSPASDSGTIPINSNKSPPDGMLVFEGTVFVASTQPIAARWTLAGWRIASRQQAAEGDQVPSDCTLYPHQGVDDQWIGSCSGYIFIPKDGASHIAVMHTRSDGNTVMVQVAPQPD